MLLLLPAAILTLGIVGYPLLLEGWFSLSTAGIGSDGSFVGLANFSYLAGLATFREVLGNTAVYTLSSTAVKALLGLGMALVLAKPFPGRRLIYAPRFLPRGSPQPAGRTSPPEDSHLGSDAADPGRFEEEARSCASAAAGA
ncbi:MAG: hypothetical protein M3024_03200 [Candidatus Dormibacteraeota bacterium]|nr:hypothetical protein [Candidatus Dormibacteraeota bacterium]